ncbi:uncharacterized protein BCR38DRAFT_425277 [Pseudomassariella vexata]|uniref:DUF7907 domain-containing protein n=1 Tax=Pseudomassariella vexata TaxID=1141098 RepID=A0A1Y2EC19_9PEZI|nr:uncharacterized protein BCR38DRAFT_425277 [Pseudomassariella vexata]ORY69092.1 hypothetical protein BCR38DRAFT_425277 [Pseudomassariella vexata]
MPYNTWCLHLISSSHSTEASYSFNGTLLVIISPLAKLKFHKLSNSNLSSKMAFKMLLSTALLATTSLSSALPRQSTTLSTSYAFRLAANVTAFDTTPSAQGLELQYTDTDGCTADLILAGSGDTFYATGSNVGIADFPYPSGGSINAGITVTKGGTATVPALFPVQVSCGEGTAGVTVGPDEETGAVAELLYDGGSWMACPRDDGEGFRLIYKSAGQRTIFGCADVQLLPLCEDIDEDDIEDGWLNVACFTQ